MSNKFQLICVGVFWLAYYYFILRRWNTLGFRLFSLFFITGLTVCFWWYLGYRDLRSVQERGVATEAMVVKKAPDILEVSFQDQGGQTIARTQKGGISVEEFAAVTEGKPAPILYVPGSDVIFLKPSYDRQLRDNPYFLFFPGLLFVIAIGSWIFLRSYRVLPHEGTLYEYVVNEQGKVVLDDNATPFSRAMRTGSTMSKFWQLFGK